MTDERKREPARRPRERKLTDALGSNREKLARALARMLWADKRERARREAVRELDR